MWVDGEATLAGVDLLSLQPPRLVSVLTAMYIRFSFRDEDHRKVYNEVVLEMTKLARTDVEEWTETDIGAQYGLREGPVGDVEG